MIKFLKTHPAINYIVIGLLLLLGIVLLRYGMTRDVVIFVNDEDQTIRTAALTVAGALRAAGIRLAEGDQVMPDPASWLGNQSVIQVNTAFEVSLHTPEEEQTFMTVERIPANILQEAGITLSAQDRLLVNGTPVDPDTPLDVEGEIMLQYTPTILIHLDIDGQETAIYTYQATLGAALADAGIQISTDDAISEDLLAPVTEAMTVTIRRARPVTVRIGETMISGETTAATVGEALQDAGIALQNLDYSLPAGDQPVPESGEIEVIQVREAVLLTTDEVAYENEYVQDPEALLGTYSVVEPGQVGIYVSRERVTYENGEEVHRILDDQWQASEPRDGVMGIGTKVEIRTEVVDGVTIEYWRKKTVYATSYKPCDNQGVCHDGTAGGYPLQKGIVAVTPQWYSVPNGLAMADLPVYIPGYGRAIIGDVGGGIPGTPWIDLAYRDANYVSWHHWTTMYFLTPVPDYYPAIITP